MEHFLCLKQVYCCFTFVCVYISHSDCLVLILKSDNVPMCLHAVKNVVNKKTFSCKHESTFYRKNMTSFLNYITATLRGFFPWRAAHIAVMQYWRTAYRIQETLQLSLCQFSGMLFHQFSRIFMLLLIFCKLVFHATNYKINKRVTLFGIENRLWFYLSN